MCNSVEADDFASPLAPALFGVIIRKDGFFPARALDENLVGFGVMGYFLTLTHRLFRNTVNTWRDGMHKLMNGY